MRLSVRQDDIGYIPNAFGSKAILDGVEIPDCFTADEELGIAYCYERNAHGEHIICDGYVKEIARKGVVKIILADSCQKQHWHHRLWRWLRN